MSYKIGGLRNIENTGMTQVDGNIINEYPLRQQYIKDTKDIKTINKDAKNTKNIIDSSSLTEEFIKQLLNSKEYQDKRIEERKYNEKNKKFKTVKISPNITYTVFDKVKIVDMTPPVGMSIDDCE